MQCSRLLDLIIVAAMTSSMGKGCAFSAIPIFLLEGGVTLLSTLIAKTEFGLLLNAFQQVFQLNWSTAVILRCDIACSQMTGTICRPKDVRLCRGNACEGSAGYDCGRSLE